jgi:hypothetical protein
VVKITLFYKEIGSLTVWIVMRIIKIVSTLHNMAKYEELTLRINSECRALIHL